MNIVLRILVIVTLILNGVALWFANALYNKRELLVDSNTDLRAGIVKIASTLEAPAPETEGEEEALPTTRVDRDISTVESSNADIPPDYSSFWKSYDESLEKVSAESYEIPEPLDLAQVYVLDPTTKQAKRDATGRPIRTGSLLNKVIDEVVRVSNEQRVLANKVRAQLTKIREEYEDAVVELNQVKKDARKSLKTIEEKEAQISTLEDEKRGLEEQISGLKEQITSLEEEKQTLQQDLDLANENLEAAQNEVKTLKEQLENIAKMGIQSGGGAAAAVAGANVAAGPKGKLVRVDNEYNFCVLELTDEAYAEIIGEDGSLKMPEMECWIYRDNVDAPLAKIRFTNVVKNLKAVTADILVDWKQAPLAPGDKVIYMK